MSSNPVYTQTWILGSTKVLTTGITFEQSVTQLFAAAGGGGGAAVPSQGLLGRGVWAVLRDGADSGHLARPALQLLDGGLPRAGRALQRRRPQPHGQQLGQGAPAEQSGRKLAAHFSSRGLTSWAAMKTRSFEM